MVSVLQIDHLKRDDCEMTLSFDMAGKKDFYLPIEKSFSFSDAGNWWFPDNKIVLDITELSDEISEIAGGKIF